MTYVFPPIEHLIGDRSTGFPDFDDRDEFDEDDGDDEQDGVVFDSADYETVGSGPNGEWTDEDEAGLEEYEENKRRRIAEANEY